MIHAKIFINMLVATSLEMQRYQMTSLQWYRLNLKLMKWSIKRYSMNKMICQNNYFCKFWIVSRSILPVKDFAWGGCTRKWTKIQKDGKMGLPGMHEHRRNWGTFFATLPTNCRSYMNLQQICTKNVKKIELFLLKSLGTLPLCFHSLRGIQSPSPTFWSKAHKTI